MRFLLPGWSSKQTNRTIEQQISLLSSDVIFLLWWSLSASLSLLKQNEKNHRKYTKTGTTLPFPCMCFSLSSFPGSSLRVKSFILDTHCSFFGLLLCIYFIVSISDCFPQPCAAVVFCTRYTPISKQTDVSIQTHQHVADSDVRRVCLHVDVSTLIQASLFSLSSVCSRCCAGCQNGSLLWKKKRWKATYFSVCRNWEIDFEIHFRLAGGDEPNSARVRLDATACYLPWDFWRDCQEKKKHTMLNG